MDEGISIQVKVQPRARRKAIARTGDTLRVAVTAAPEDGKANRAVLKALAEALDVAPSSLTILKGRTGAQKLIRVEGDAARLRRRLALVPAP